MNFSQYLALAFEIYSVVSASLAAIKAGQAVSTPPVNTYLEGKHVAIVVNISPLA